MKLFTITINDLPATGTVNGLNTVYSFTEKPNCVVADGVWYKELDSNGVVQWSWNPSVLSVTMAIAPKNSIYGLA